MTEQNLPFFILLFVSLWGEEKGSKVTWETIFHTVFSNKTLTKIFLCKLWFLYILQKQSRVTKCTVATWKSREAGKIPSRMSLASTAGSIKCKLPRAKVPKRDDPTASFSSWHTLANLEGQKPNILITYPKISFCYLSHIWFLSSYFFILCRQYISHDI